MHVQAPTPQDTEALGARLARGCPPLDETFAVIYLSGDLGVGKTTLARGFLRELGVKTAIRSPTYTLLELYETDPLTTLHLDLYRLVDPAELEELGLREWARPRHIWLIEWPERGGSRLPPPDLLIALRALAHGHEIAPSAASALGESWLGRLA